MKKTLILLSGLAVLFLSGCATSYKASSYQAGHVQQAMKVVAATVIEVREVDIEVKPSGGGMAAGAAAGSMAGSTLSRGGIVAGIAGAVVGGVAGNLIEKGVSAKKGIEIVYRPDNSDSMMALVQEVDSDNPIRAGDRVRIMEGSFSSRAVRIGS